MKTLNELIRAACRRWSDFLKCCCARGASPDSFLLRKGLTLKPSANDTDPSVSYQTTTQCQLWIQLQYPPLSNTRYNSHYRFLSSCDTGAADITIKL
jgi:hypothetical protein